MLKIKKLSYFYDKKKILNNLNLDIADGEKVAIVGKSGSGKTTLLNIILGNLKPQKGQVLFKGLDIYCYSNKQKNEYKRYYISNIFQSLNLLEEKTVEDNLLYFSNKSNVYELLKKLKLLDLKDKKINELSGGQKQKVAIARACLKKPELLICDEITSSLDAKTAQEVLDFIFSIFQNQTIIIVSHDYDMIKKYVNKILFLEEGKINKEEKISEFLFSKSNNIKEKITFFNNPYKFNLIPIILCFLASLSLFFSLSFYTFYGNKIKNAITNYYDHDIVEIINYQEEKFNLDEYIQIEEDINPILEKFTFIINNQEILNFTLKPIFNAKYTMVFNGFFLNDNNLENFNEINLKFDNESLTIKNIDFITEENLFSTSIIYYDYLYFRNYLHEKNLLVETDSYIGYLKKDLIVCYNKTLEDNNFTNNPFLYSNQANKMYLSSNALLEYLTLNELNVSYQQLTSTLIKLVIFFTIIALIIYYLLNFFKNVKKIAIFKNFGFTTIEILKNDFLDILISVFLIFFIIFFFLKVLNLFNYLSFFLEALFIYFNINLFCLLITYFYFRKKDLNKFLLEDYVC